MRADLLVIGAGAKAAAVAAKVHAINELGYGPVSLTIVEDNEPAASWLGLNGMTSGDETLAIPPVKDVGFPYESGRAFGELGDEVDGAMLSFSWSAYLIAGRRYARWINAESPSVRHRDYGMYLAWVHSRATSGVRRVHGRAASITLDGDGWAVEVVTPEGARVLIRAPEERQREPYERPARHTQRRLFSTLTKGFLATCVRAEAAGPTAPLHLQTTSAALTVGRLKRHGLSLQ